MEDKNGIKDCLLHVYSFLPLEDLYQCMQVNELFYKASQNSYVWLQLLERDYKNLYKRHKKDSLYETYKCCKESDVCTEQLISDLKNMLEKIGKHCKMELELWQGRLQFMQVSSNYKS